MAEYRPMGIGWYNPRREIKGKARAKQVTDRHNKAKEVEEIQDRILPFMRGLAVQPMLQAPYSNSIKCTLFPFLEKGGKEFA